MPSDRDAARLIQVSGMLNLVLATYNHALMMGKIDPKKVLPVMEAIERMTDLIDQATLKDEDNESPIH